MRADDNIDLSCYDVLQRCLDLFRRPKPAQHLDPHRERSKALFERLEMLERQYSRRGQDCDLFAIAQRLESSAHRNFRLAEADIPAEQPVHRLLDFHDALDMENL